MQVIVNGKPQDVPEGLTVRELIERVGLAESACAAEVNRELVPRRDQAEHRLHAGDHVELVTLVGGG